MCNSCVIVETLRYGFSDQIIRRARLRAENVDISYHRQPTATAKGGSPVAAESGAIDLVRWELSLLLGFQR
jgi:hypothetical protein